MKVFENEIVKKVFLHDDDYEGKKLLFENERWLQKKKNIDDCCEINWTCNVHFFSKNMFENK